MKRNSTTASALPATALGAVGKAWEEVSASFDRFCLAAGLETLGMMMEKDAEESCGPRHWRGERRRGHRWGRTQGKIGFHGGKVELARPRVRDLAGKELALPSWQQAVAEDWLGRWAMNLMLINVSTRKIRRAVRLPEGDVPAAAGAGVSKSAASRHFVALSAARMREWLASDLSALDLLVVQIDGIHITEHLVLVAAIGIDGEGVKHPLGLIEGATENAAVVQALVRHYLLQGLVQCGVCGSRCSSSRRYHKVVFPSGKVSVYHRSVYRCNRRAQENMHDRTKIERCRNSEIGTHILEGKVFEMIEEIMLDPGQLRGRIGTAGLDDRSTARELARVARKISAVEEERRQMIDRYAADGMTGDEYIAASRGLDEKLERLVRVKAKLAAALRSPGDPHPLMDRPGGEGVGCS